MKIIAAVLLAAVALSTGCITSVPKVQTDKGAFGVAASIKPEWTGALTQARNLLVGKDPYANHKRELRWYYKGQEINPIDLMWRETLIAEGGLSSLPSGAAIGPLRDLASESESEAAARAKAVADITAMLEAVEGGQAND
jgi:hypothetical protein